MPYKCPALYNKTTPLLYSTAQFNTFIISSTVQIHLTCTMLYSIRKSLLYLTNHLMRYVHFVLLENIQYVSLPNFVLVYQTCFQRRVRDKEIICIYEEFSLCFLFAGGLLRLKSSQLFCYQEFPTLQNIYWLQAR